jgi:hypothetical protein
MRKNSGRKGKRGSSKYSKGAQKKIGDVMREFYDGKLKHGGSGETVKDPSVAKAIAMSEARERGMKVPKKPRKRKKGRS